ncbi:MAG TPA: hypothetical protein VL356_12845 [Acidocella sp.]|jgi:hypothetical protein|nr:hypothetical protein [Acidocella sp.]
MKRTLLALLWRLGLAKPFASSTAPVLSNGTAALAITVRRNPGGTGAVTMPFAGADGWACSASDLTTTTPARVPHQRNCRD